jgi:hypothetical protein
VGDRSEFFDQWHERATMKLKLSSSNQKPELTSQERTAISKFVARPMASKLL